MRKQITAENVRVLFDYNPETGELIWRPRPLRLKTARTDRTFNTNFAGKVAGHFDDKGYMRLVGYDPDRAHRIIWLYAYGFVPDCEIDHINGIRNDNRLCNLRLATRAENTRNAFRRTDNRSGHRGVAWEEDTKRWRAYLNFDGKRHYLGRFVTLEEAIKARCSAADLLHGEFARNV